MPTVRPARRADGDGVRVEVPHAPAVPELALEIDVEAEPARPVRRPGDAEAPRIAPIRHLPTIGRFGDYDIVGRLALGGMAEILLAREQSPGAGSRYVVVKRILPEFEHDHSFVEMFLDEARVMMRLRHPNVCHVYKFGQHDGTHYIAMEWVNGASLGKLIRRARGRGGLPIPVACKVIALVAEALDHAHTATDEQGRPLGIVHRDVTPDNIMVSFDGAVKLLDFGIAKAEERSHQTQAGVVKGKFAYMAPEQCRARPMDHRVDIFALGVCLYESLTGKPLYRRDTEFETMEAIVRGPLPQLAERMRHPPAELESIVARCLAKQPEDRYTSAAELQDALDRFVGARGEVVNARKIRETMNTLFAEELERGPMVDTTPFGSSYHVQAEQFEVPVLEGNASPPRAIESIAPPAVSGVSSTGRVLPPPARATVAPPRRRRSALRTPIVIAAAAIVALIAIGLTARALLGDEAPRATLATGRLTVDSTPSGAAIAIDGDARGTTPRTIEGLATGTHTLRLTLDEYEPHEARIEVRANEPHRVAPALVPLAQDRAPTAAESGRLTITSTPSARVFLEGQELGQTPIRDARVPAGVVRLTLETPDGRSFVRGAVVRADDYSSVDFNLE